MIDLEHLVRLEAILLDLGRRLNAITLQLGGLLTDCGLHLDERDTVAACRSITRRAASNTVGENLVSGR